MSTSPSIVRCTNCDALKAAYNRVECTILELIRNKWTNISYNTSLFYSQAQINRLIRYRRLLYSRMFNPRYPCGAIDSQDLIKLAVHYAYISGDCSDCPECFPPTSTTTTTTTTIEPGCCNVSGATGEVTTAQLYYWGWKDDNTVLSEAEIIASPNFDTFIPGQDLTAYYAGGVATPQFLWMAEPSTEPLKTKWQDLIQALNNGAIGSGLDLFDAPVISGNFRFYITVYVTQQSNPIEFRVI